MTPIKARSHFTDADDRALMRHAARDGRRRVKGRAGDGTGSFLNLFLVFIVALIAFLLMPVAADTGWITPPATDTVTAFLAGLAAGFALLAAMAASWQRRFTDATAAERPAWARELEWAIDENGVVSRTSRTESRFRWAAVTAASELPGGFLILVAGLTYHWIPRGAFESESDASRFASLLHSRGKPADGAAGVVTPPE